MPDVNAPRGTSLRRRLEIIKRSNPDFLDRLADEMRARPWLRDQIDPSLTFLIGRDFLPMDFIVALGIALDDWPAWLLVGERPAPPAIGFLRCLAKRLAMEDPAETGPIKPWLTHLLNQDNIATTLEIESWFAGEASPRRQLYDTFEEALGITRQDITKAIGTPEPPSPSLAEMLDRYPAAPPPPGTWRIPVGNAPLPRDLSSNRIEKLGKPLNAQRILRILSDASGTEADNRLIARWLRKELVPSELEVALVIATLPISTKLISTYRAEIECGLKLMACSQDILFARKRMRMNFLERLAAAFHAAGVVQISAPREQRLAILQSDSLPSSAHWLSEDAVPPEEELAHLVAMTGIHRAWFTDGIASPHSILG